MFYTNLVSFGLGILVEKFFDLGFYLSLFFITLLTSLIFILRKEKRATKILLAFLFLSLGIFRMSLSDSPTESELRSFSGQSVSFDSTILDEPDVRESSVRYIVQLDDIKKNPAEKCTDIFLLKNSSCSVQSTSQGISQRGFSDILVLLVADRFPEFQYGDQISVSGTIETPENFLNENGVEFDYVSYLAKDNIHFLMYRPEIERVGEGEKNFIVSFLYKIKKSFIKNIERVVPEPNSSLLAGILVGAKNSLGENLLDDFKNVGLIHIVVLSGYNITIVIYCVLLLTSKIERRSLKFFIAGSVATLFVLMVGLGATVLRASIMAAIAILAKYYGRESDALRALFIAGLVMLLWNPLTLISDPSFQLSFMATLGLILFSPIVENYISKQKILSKILPAKWQIREIASSTIAVQLFLLPILVRMSGSFSLVSFFVNILVLPVIQNLMLFGFLTGILGFAPITGGILSWVPGSLSYIISEYVIRVTEIGSSLPLATIKTGALPVFIVLLWYLGAVFVYGKFRRE